MLKNLLNLLFPKLCNGCNSLLLKNEAIICSTCRHGLPLTQHHNLKDNYTTKKFYGIIPVEFSASMLFFHKEGIVQNLIHNLKYRKHQEIGTFLGNWYAEDLKEIAKKHDFSEIIPVPLHKKRLEERGYNQITTFCESLSKKLEIHYNPKLITRFEWEADEPSVIDLLNVLVSDSSCQNRKQVNTNSLDLSLALPKIRFQAVCLFFLDSKKTPNARSRYTGRFCLDNIKASFM